jgi:hypothetical protein
VLTRILLAERDDGWPFWTRIFLMALPPLTVFAVFGEPA